VEPRRRSDPERRRVRLELGNDLDGRRQRRLGARGHARPRASRGGVADRIARLAELRDRGALTDAEFQAQKAKLL